MLKNIQKAIFFLSYNPNSYIMGKVKMKSDTSLFGYFTDSCPPYPWVSQ